MGMRYERGARPNLHDPAAVKQDGLEEQRKIYMRKDRREQTSWTLFSRSEFQEGSEEAG